MSNSDKVMPPHAGTVFYGPTYQFVIRLLLGALTLIYYFFLPVPLFILNLYFIYFVISAYFVFHIAWWFRFRKKGISVKRIRLANWIDLIAAGLTVVLDPYAIPPTIVLILIVVLGNGIQHGLKNFIVVAKNAIPVCLVAIPLHFLICRQWPPYSFYFLILFLISCGHYSFFLVKRIELLKKNAENLAQKDELTGLMNRRAFMVSAQYLVSLHNRTQIPLVLVFADLDGFKKVNDFLGHAAGDRVLETFGRLSAQNFRQTDIAARYGGDEFVYILADSSLENAQKVLHRLETQFMEWAGMQNIKVGISYGIREVNNEKITLDRIMKEADDALYAEKRKKGRAIEKAGPV